MTPDTPYRLTEIERRLAGLERRLDEMKFEAVLVRVSDCREDIGKLGDRMDGMDSRLGRILWLLVTTIATVGGSALLIAVSIGVH